MDSKEFETKLLDLLKSGGTKELKEALAPFGLDPTDPAFWDASFKQYLGSLLDEAESLAASLGYVKQQVGK
jgi:oligoendopeptidase F